MHNPRAARIARGSPASSSRPCDNTTSRASRGPRLNLEVVIQAWGRFMATFRMIIRHYIYKDRLSVRLSPIGYEAWVDAPPAQIPSQPTQHRRVIGSGDTAELVGDKLPTLRKGTPRVDPDICEHPTSDMHRKGNGKSRTWTCGLCLTGWKRHPLNASQTPQPTDIITFGKHKNRTFEDIATEFPDYARFIVTTADEEPDQPSNFLRLANYLRAKGKGRGSVPAPRGRPSPKQPAHKRGPRPPAQQTLSEDELQEAREAVGRVHWAARTTAPDTSHMPNLPADSSEEDASMSEDEQYPQDWEETSSTLL